MVDREESYANPELSTTTLTIFRVPNTNFITKLCVIHNGSCFHRTRFLTDWLLVAFDMLKENNLDSLKHLSGAYLKRGGLSRLLDLVENFDLIIAFDKILFFALSR